MFLVANGQEIFIARKCLGKGSIKKWLRHTSFTVPIFMVGDKWACGLRSGAAAYSSICRQIKKARRFLAASPLRDRSESATSRAYPTAMTRFVCQQMTRKPDALSPSVGWWCRFLAVAPECRPCTRVFFFIIMDSVHIHIPCASWKLCKDAWQFLTSVGNVRILTGW